MKSGALGGAIYGHDTAYSVGQIGGTVTGVAAGLLVGNAAAGANGLIACGTTLQRAAQVCTTVQTIGGMAAAGINIHDGKAGVGDLLAFAPAVGYVGAKAGQALGVLRKNCFVAGTMVVVRIENGQLVEKPIEEIQVGDTVLARNEHDPNAPLEERAVTQVFVRTTIRRQLVTITHGDGTAETLKTTPEHPFYVEGQGWTEAGSLEAGDELISPDGTRQVVSASLLKLHPEGVTVYNFEVEGDHTYFVDADAAINGGVVWVHNASYGGNAASHTFVDMMDHSEAVEYRKYWQRHAPVQAPLSIRKSRAIKLSAEDGVTAYSATSQYDNVGRLKGRTDYTGHGYQKGAIHPDPHYHVRNVTYGDQSAPGWKSNGEAEWLRNTVDKQRHWPGEYPS